MLLFFSFRVAAKMSMSYIDDDNWDEDEFNKNVRVKSVALNNANEIR